MRKKRKERRLTIEEVTWSVVEIMDKVGIPEEKIYAFAKTGILLSEDNIDHFESEQVNAWFDAVDEYRAYMETAEYQAE